MQTRLLSGILALTLSAFAAGLPATQTFEGRWVLDKKKTSASPKAPENLVQQIKMDGSQMIVRSKFDQPKNGIYPILWVGIMSEEMRLATDGSESSKSIGPFEFRAKTNQDGNSLVTSYTANMENGSAPGQPEGSVEGQWIRNLSEDGRTMTLQMKSKCSDGRTIDTTLYFNRK